MSESTHGPNATVITTCIGVTVEPGGRVVSAVVLDDGNGFYSIIWNHDDMGDRQRVLYEFEGAATAITFFGNNALIVADSDGIAHVSGDGDSWLKQQVSRRALICVRQIGGELLAAGRLGVFRLSGTTWASVGNPNGEAIDDIGGSSSTELYAVGFGGAAQLQSRGWVDLALPDNADLISIFAAGKDDVLIGGKDGAMFRGTGALWQPVAIGKLSVYSITQYFGQIYLACADDGLWKIVSGVVEPVRRDIPAFDIATAGNFLVACGRDQMWRFDGEAWEHRRYRHVP